MKRLSFVFCLMFLSHLAFAEGFKLSGGIGFSYMNHYAMSKYSVDNALKDISENSTTKKMYNSMMVGLDLKFGGNLTYNEFGGYLSINVGMPYKVSMIAPSPIDVLLNATALSKLNSSLITDSQLGLYVNLFSKSPVQLYFGTGVAFNWVKSQRELSSSSLSKLHNQDGSLLDVSKIASVSEQSNTKMVGIGSIIGLTCYFSESIGFFFSIHDSFYFYDMGSDSTLIGKFSNGNDFTYRIAKDGKITNDNISTFGKNTYTNNFGVKAGFSFRV